MKESCPGSREIKTPYPEEIRCFWCDAAGEIWSDEVETRCGNCGKTISREMRPSCIDWCPAARECLGAEKYERLRRGRKE
jgi:hypothetical protein